MAEIEEFLTTADIQRIFKLKSPQCARALMCSDGFPLMRIGKFYRVNPLELEKWIRQNSKKSLKLPAY